MKLIFVPAGLDRGDLYSLPEPDSRHLVKVLRLREGDVVDGSDGARRLKCRIRTAGKKVKVEILSAEPLEDTRRISIAIARIDTARLSSAVSAAAQMAAREVWAVGCERASPGHIDVGRLGRLARESAKQVGCPFLPAIEELPGITDLAAKIRNRMSFLLDPLASQTLLESFPYEIDESGLLLIVGPVGDFTMEEKQTLREAGAKPVQLCGEILRSETAAVVALGVAATCLRTARK